MFWHDFFVGIRFVAVFGVLAHLLGLIIPKSCLHYDSFPFEAFGWEKGGRFYNKFGVSRWMAKLPDMSRIIPYMFRKKLDPQMDKDNVLLFINETCLAELIHWILVFSAPFLMMLVDGITGKVFTLLYAFCNMPFIMIQRYNRPKLVRLYKRQLKRDMQRQMREEAMADEGADIVL